MSCPFFVDNDGWCFFLKSVVLCAHRVSVGVESASATGISSESDQ